MYSRLTQRKKKAIYIESLAVREAIRYWRYWLLGRHFTVITDHKPLQHLNLKARTDEELGDLANELLQFDFEILYEPGPLNYEADCLSRNPVLESSNDSFPILPTFNFLSLSEIRSNDCFVKMYGWFVFFQYNNNCCVSEFLWNKSGGNLFIMRCGALLFCRNALCRFPCATTRCGC